MMTQLELFGHEALKSINTNSNIPTAIHAFADLYEQIQKLQFERDEAIQNKAKIGDKKIATSMATASSLSRENRKLKQQLNSQRQHIEGLTQKVLEIMDVLHEYN
ncbi:cell shape-determining protein MreC [Acinetobacter lwoffii]|uniref:Cell shape-determining protein MreC n=1 Tax=Acinetobacter lwoffii TaxID=28090 RepID=A0AAW8LKN9_ACILW|nr:hypothetical protein [Acinetobacter lwoffii]MDR6631012.1 cell shape-determining protein MreC [Acinetobacter lwoffii]